MTTLVERRSLLSASETPRLTTRTTNQARAFDGRLAAEIFTKVADQTTASSNEEDAL